MAQCRVHYLTLSFTLSLLSVYRLSTLFFLLELVGGIITGSLALESDAFHMASDVIALIIGTVASSLVGKKASSEASTYGYLRGEVVAGLINGVFLLAVCFIIFIEAIQRMADIGEVKRAISGQETTVAIIGAVGLAFNLAGLLGFHSHGHSHAGHSHEHHGHAHGHAAHDDDVHEGSLLKSACHDHDHKHSKHGSAVVVQDSASHSHEHHGHKHKEHRPAETAANNRSPIKPQHLDSYGAAAQQQHDHHAHHAAETVSAHDLESGHHHGHSHSHNGHASDHGEHSGHSHSHAHSEPAAVELSASSLTAEGSKTSSDSHGHHQNHSSDQHHRSSHGTPKQEHKHKHKQKQRKHNANTESVMLHIMGDALGYV